MTGSDVNPSTPVNGGSGERHPRSLAHGSGVIFQSAGLFLAFATCCVGSLAGLAQHPNRSALVGDAPSTVVGAWREFQTHKKLATIGMFASCAAGLGVLAAGIGLQADRYGSARLAVLVTGPLAAFHVYYLGYLIFRGPISWWFPVPLAYTAIWVGLAILALASAREHKLHPPPRGVQILPKDVRLPGTSGERLAEQFRDSSD